MERVQMMVAGKLAEVDADMVKKMQRKDLLVAEAISLQAASKTSTGLALQLILDSQTANISKIIRLNRTIRSTVRFL